LNESKAMTEELRETLARCNNGLSQRDILEEIGSMLLLCDQLGYAISKTFFQEEFVEA
jgi:hypothetical protein